jgi:NAD+ kinase
MERVAQRQGAPVTAVAVVAHHERQDAAILAKTAVTWLRERGHVGWVVPDDAAVLDLGELVDERTLADADLLVCLGGDGTMLRAVRLLDGAPVPLLGVNVGVLGYLTEIDAPALTASLERFIAGAEAGDWHLDERMMLHVSVAGDGSWRALNEAVVEKHDSGHTVRLLASIAGEPFTSYAADGLIVATPTGSTAYSLSARGPIVSPKHRAMLLTPVSPHMLFDRTLVLEPSETVAIEVAGFRPAALAVDGQRVATLAEGAVVTCRPASETARFVRFSAHHFHQILKSKFGLADR